MRMVEKTQSGRTIQRSGRGHAKSKSTWFVNAEEGDPRVALFGQQVRKARIHRLKGNVEPLGLDEFDAKTHWSQEAVAERLGVSQPRWSQLERGKLEPVPQFVWRIEEDFGTVPGSFSQYLGYSPSGKNVKSAFEFAEFELERLKREAPAIRKELQSKDYSLANCYQWLEMTNLLDLGVIERSGTLAAEVSDYRVQIEEDLQVAWEALRGALLKFNDINLDVVNQFEGKVKEFAAIADLKLKFQGQELAVKMDGGR
jgi:transcriptional regulator with XRE-family HTH domain